MFSPFCILAFCRHCVRITFSDTAQWRILCICITNKQSALQKTFRTRSELPCKKRKIHITFQCWHADATLGRLTLHNQLVFVCSQKINWEHPLFVCVSKTNASSLHGAISFRWEWKKSTCLYCWLENLSLCVVRNAPCITHEEEVRYGGLRVKCFLIPQPPLFRRRVKPNVLRCCFSLIT